MLRRLFCEAGADQQAGELAVGRMRPEQVDKLRAMAKRLERVPPMAISLWNTVLKLAPGDKEAHSQLARLLVTCWSIRRLSRTAVQ